MAWSYTQMGVIHIFGGIDHLLFLFALLLLVVGFRKLVKTITAFTLAHSVTLGLAALGVVNIPTAPTEAVIALNIMFLATEIIRVHAGRRAFTAEHPWVVAMIFGLFHGLGFAGALTQVGLPSHEIPIALLMFNVGVELGQIAFVCVVLGVITLVRNVKITWPEQSWRLLPYTIGGVAAFWTIQRVGAFF